MSGLAGIIGPTGPTGPSGGAIWSLTISGDVSGSLQNAVVGQYLVVSGLVGDSVRLPILNSTANLLIISNIDNVGVEVSSTDALINRGAGYVLPGNKVGIFISNPTIQNWDVFVSI